MARRAMSLARYMARDYWPGLTIALLEGGEGLVSDPILQGRVNKIIGHVVRAILGAESSTHFYLIFPLSPVKA